MGRGGEEDPHWILERPLGWGELLEYREEEEAPRRCVGGRTEPGWRKEGGHQGWQQEDQQSRQLPKPEHCLLFPERLLHELRAFKGDGIVNGVRDYQ